MRKPYPASSYQSQKFRDAVPDYQAIEDIANSAVIELIEDHAIGSEELVRQGASKAKLQSYDKKFEELSTAIDNTTTTYIRYLLSNDPTEMGIDETSAKKDLDEAIIELKKHAGDKLGQEYVRNVYKLVEEELDKRLGQSPKRG